MRLLSFTLLALMLATSAFAAPSKLILKNQFGEESINVVIGSAAPIVPGSSNIVSFAGATAPINGTTGDNFAAKGSIYIAIDTGAMYQNTGTITAPVWTAFAASNASGLLTGLSVSAALLASSDTVLQGFNKLGALQNGTFVPTVQALSATGAVSTTSMETTVTNAGSTYAVTLAAPSSQDGQLKIIKSITAMSGTVTLAMTNIAMSGGYTPTGTTTLTFSTVGQSAIFMAVGSKWVYLGGSAVAS